MPPHSVAGGFDGALPVLETAGYPNESPVTQQAAKDTDYDLAPQTSSSGGDGICSGVRAGGDRLSARSGPLSGTPRVWWRHRSHGAVARLEVQASTPLTAFKRNADENVGRTIGLVRGRH